MATVYVVVWDCYDFASDCEYQRSARFKTREDAENFAKNNDLGCWYIREYEEGEE